jgi:hypothetical protein
LIPTARQDCEACGERALDTVFDARVKRTNEWPKGHWMFLCDVCHFIYGLGYDPENLVLYKKGYDEFHEILGEISMSSQSIREAVRRMATASDPKEEAKIFLIGEIGIQLSLMVSEQTKAAQYAQATLQEMRNTRAAQETHNKAIETILKSMVKSVTDEEEDEDGY